MMLSLECLEDSFLWCTTEYVSSIGKIQHEKQLWIILVYKEEN